MLSFLGSSQMPARNTLKSDIRNLGPGVLSFRHNNPSLSKRKRKKEKKEEKKKGIKKERRKERFKVVSS